MALRYATHPYADEALAKLESLTPPVRLTLPEHMKRRALLDGGMASQALEELAKAEDRKLVKGAPAKAEVALVRAQALFATKQPEEAEKSLAEARKGPPAIAAEAALVTARRALRANENEKARELMAALDKAWAKQPAGDEGAFFAGWLDFQGGRYEDAVKSFASFEKRYPRSRRRDEGMWFRALSLLKLEKYSDAREELSRLVDSFPRSSLVPQARYWMARSQELGGKAVDVTGPAYESVLNIAPASFYALLASERLKALGRTPPPVFPEPPKQLTVPRPPGARAGGGADGSGPLPDASEEVEAQASRIHSPEQALPVRARAAVHGPVRLCARGRARTLWGRAFGERARRRWRPSTREPSPRRWSRRPRATRWSHIWSGPSCVARAPSGRRWRARRTLGG